ncbi:hypothetical protein ACFQNF_19260 [Iodobacter arcticus]|uniref:DUF4189 domain-containing protein n=1 Tax=Iodobacter arcticus TaxID=590593 RepID=A0ABW2R3X2_9NEIS
MMKILAASLLILLSTTALAGDVLLKLKAEIGTAQCTQDTQCRTVAVGAKSCGGPEFYLPWSIAEGRAEKIALLAKKYTDQRLLEIKQSGELSTCQFVADPGAVCKQKQCVLQSKEAIY